MSEFEAKLLQKGYEKLPPFFVLREGEISDERTGGVVKLTKDRLESIAETQNKRIINTGDATPVIVGHTKRHLLEKDQPEEVGLTTNFRVVKFFKTNTWGLEATPWAKPEDKIHFEKFKRRSAELWTDPDLIDPISLLGANTPRLDLGLHQFSKADNRYVFRQPLVLEMDDMADDKDPADKPAGDKPAASPANAGQTSDMADLKAKVDQLMQMMSLLQPLIDELQGGGAGDPSGGMGGGAPMGGPPGMPPGAPMGGPPGMPPGGGGPPPQPMQAGAGPAGGPEMQGPQQYGMGYPTSYPIQMGYQQQNHNPQVAQEVAQLRTMVATLQLQKLESDVDSILDKLESEIVIDRPRDRARLVKLSRDDQEQEVAHMRATRKTKEAPLPGSGLPMDQHYMPAGPMQMSLGTASDGLTLPGDPNAGKQKPSQHDILMEIVRNRGNMNAMQAYEKIMQPNPNGTPVI